MNAFFALEKSDGHDVDQLLAAYFQAQLPHPWPAWSPPTSHCKPSAGRCWRRQLLAAASLLLLLVGYLGLARLFPSSPVAPFRASPNMHLGEKPGIPTAQPGPLPHPRPGSALSPLPAGKHP